MFQFHPNNPLKEPAWRWNMARFMRENKIRKPKTAQMDHWIINCLNFQRRLDRCKSDVNKWSLMDKFSDIYAAYLIYRNGDEDIRHPLRYVIEARLLSGQSYAEIANKLGMSAKTIECYEKVFFNIIDKLEYTDYIMTCVLGPAVQQGLSDRDYDLLWKLFGYLYGPVVLDTFITTTSRRMRPEKHSEVDVALADDTRSSLQRKVAITAKTYSVNQFSQSELLNIYTKMIEVEKEMESGKAQDVIMQNIQIMLDKLPFSTGSVPPNNIAVAQFDMGSAELRTNELLALTTETPIELQEVETLAFPEGK